MNPSKKFGSQSQAAPKNAILPMRVPASAPSSRGNQTSANCASDRAATDPTPKEIPELPELPELPEPRPKSERNSATTCANVADAAGSAVDRTSSSAAARDGSKPATAGDASVHARTPAFRAALAASTAAAADHRAIKSSTRWTHRRRGQQRRRRRGEKREQGEAAHVGLDPREVRGGAGDVAGVQRESNSCEVFQRGSRADAAARGRRRRGRRGGRPSRGSARGRRGGTTPCEARGGAFQTSTARTRR